jgi:hypothetical protein
MSAERRNLPDWARRERMGDMLWIQDNLELFFAATALFYEDAGRGALVVDTTQQPVEGLGHPFGYFNQDSIEEVFDDDTRRMVQEYQPDREMVIVLLKSDARTSTYRVRSQPAAGMGGADKL